MEEKVNQVEQQEEPPSGIEKFKEKYYSNVTNEEWSNWKWQLTNRITTREELEKFVNLNQEESALFNRDKEVNFSITPYYMHLVLQSNAIRKCVIPTIWEKVTSNFELEDPLCEEKTNPVKCIVHRYPDRCLFLVSDFCASKCRYCTRSRIVGKDNSFSSIYNWGEAYAYIKKHTEIKDVIISGGDPFTLSDVDKGLKLLLDMLYTIDHVKIVRIGTKMPVVCPQRFNESLMTILEDYWKKLYINIHFSHPKELTSETKEVCLKLVKLGIPLGSQTVLLNGVNDNVETMKSLMQGLLECKVIPRYLYSMDRILGSGHFKVPIEKGKEIIRGIQGHTSGMACPKYVIDSENGKIPVDIGYTEKIMNNQYKLKNYEGKELIYNN
jgi:lysine 2,3-aminomutase